MATDVEMTGVEPITEDGEVPPPPIVEQWTPDQLFSFAPIAKILWNEKSRRRFRKAGISSSVYLRDGGVRVSWLYQCRLPIGPCSDLPKLAQTIKNIGREKWRGNAFRLGCDKPANTFTVQSPPAPWHGELPTSSDVEQWTPEDVLDHPLIKDVFKDPEDGAAFAHAKIDGKAFLLRGEDRRFWTGGCHLPLGPGAKLADLAHRIKNMGKEKWPGIADHLGSDQPVNPSQLSHLQKTRLNPRTIMGEGGEPTQHRFL